MKPKLFFSNRQCVRRAATAIAATLLLGSSAAMAADTPLYLDKTQPIDARVNDLLSRMTVEEKISQVRASGEFWVAGVDRLQIPVRWLDDGPMGVREDTGDNWRPMGHTTDFSTALPSTIALAAAFDPDLATAAGKTIGSEARNRNKQIMLGPSVNIQRTPLGGRSFEFMGEDPFLAGKIASAYIRGEQSEQVASCVKHFACNNQEAQRGSIDVELDDRTLHEIYLPAFRTAVKDGGVLSLMAAYNKVRGSYCSENDLLLNQILKGSWGFKGLTMTDWGAAHSTDGEVLHGMDLEMGTRQSQFDQFYMGQAFLDGIKSGKYPISLLDDKVRRNLYVMFSIGAIDGRPPGEQNSVAHQMTARLVDEEATVLLKNQDSLLPLDTGKIKSIAVIGDLATRKLAAAGGSTGLKAFYEIPPLDGIIGRAGPGVTVTYAAGFTPQPAGRGGGRGGRRGGATQTTTTAPISTATSVFAPSNAASELAQAVAAARAADVAIVVVGDDHRGSNELEGIDRTTLNLPYSQDELVRQVAAANPKTIVVLITGAPVEMPWIDQTPAVIESWFGGMEGGNAIARVLFGDVNPSGRLPCTFPKRLADTPTATLGNYPGQNGVEHYTEGLLVGYRWYDAKQIEPLFPFGYGLSYTTFDYSELKVAPMASTGSGTDMTATFTIANTGHRDSAEVAEAYVHPLKPGVFRPEKELKGFARSVVAAGKSAAVSIPLNASSFAYYDPDKKKWVAEAGDYEIEIGTSSRDIRVKAIVHLDTTTMYDD